MSTFESARKSLARWVGGFAAVAALSIAGTMVVAAPASAATGDCPSGSTCYWKDSNYATGGVGWIYFEYQNGARDFSRYNFDFGNGPVNDNATSVYNNGNSQYSYTYVNSYFNGLLLQLATKTGSGNLTGYSNDSASSGGFSYCIANPREAKCI